MEDALLEQAETILRMQRDYDFILERTKDSAALARAAYNAQRADELSKLLKQALDAIVGKCGPLGGVAKTTPGGLKYTMPFGCCGSKESTERLRQAGLAIQKALYLDDPSVQA